MIAISSAFSKTLIAIDINGKQEFIELDEKIKQSENLLKYIDEILDKNQLSIKDNHEYGVVIGPGSFTGLRIGLALVKGLCAGSQEKNKIVGISSLDLLAYEYVKKYKPSHEFVCVLNALSGLGFVCEYSYDGKKNGDEKLVELEKFSENKLIKIGLKGENIADINVDYTAQSLLEFANNLVLSGKVCDEKTLSPVYLRKSQAESALEEKNLKKS